MALNDADAGLFLFELAVAVALGAAFLVIYYNKRLTNVRNDALKTQEFIASKKIDIEKITGKAPKPVTWLYDWGELVVFAIILFISIIPAWVVASAILLKNSEQGADLKYIRNGVGPSVVVLLRRRPLELPLDSPSCSW